MEEEPLIQILHLAGIIGIWEGQPTSVAEPVRMGHHKSPLRDRYMVTDGPSRFSPSEFSMPPPCHLVGLVVVDAVIMVLDYVVVSRDVVRKNMVGCWGWGSLEFWISGWYGALVGLGWWRWL